MGESRVIERCFGIFGEIGSFPYEHTLEEFGTFTRIDSFYPGKKLVPGFSDVYLCPG